jgi:hypothetical protein
VLAVDKSAVFSGLVAHGPGMATLFRPFLCTTAVAHLICLPGGVSHHREFFGRHAELHGARAPHPWFCAIG